MRDFSSALYLGLRHPSDSLRPWGDLTTGRPVALDPPPDAAAVAAALAALQGCERGSLATSTLHLFWDLFTIVATDDSTIHVDGGAYPIARWGVERIRGRVPVHTFDHHRPDALARQLRRARGRPIVVADGFCPACGRPAPLAEYLQLLRTSDGLLVLDDTQALGILGERPSPDAPYGTGGGGSLRHADVGGGDIVVASSLAKAFGAPIAVLCGSAARVRQFEAESRTRVHCSGPSTAALRAAERALRLNRRVGDRLRGRLAASVARFREGMRQAGVALAGGHFPVQTLAAVRGGDAIRLHDHLHRRGIRPVLHRARRDTPARLGFLITARHSDDDIDRAIEAVAQGVKILDLEASSCHPSTTRPPVRPASRTSRPSQARTSRPIRAMSR